MRPVHPRNFYAFPRLHLNVPGWVHDDTLARLGVAHQVAELAHLLGRAEDLVLHQVQNTAPWHSKVSAGKKLQR